MLQPLVISILVSALGWMVYAFYLRRSFSPFGRKKILGIIVGASLLVPFFAKIPYFNTYETQTEKYEQALQRFTAQLNVVDLNDPNLKACYKRAEMGEGSMCDCEVAQKQEMVIFKENQYYHYVLLASGYFSLILFAVGIFFLIDLSLKLLYLRNLTSSFKGQHMDIESTPVVLLSPDTPFPAGSFMLFGKNYIILPSNWYNLEIGEQEAILIHELSHLKQKDTLFLVGFDLLKVLWWVNPFFYLIRNDFNLQSEHIADRSAVNHTGNVKSYAEMLLKMQQKGPKITVVSGFGGSVLKKRVMSLINSEIEDKPRKLNIWLTSIGTLLLTANVILIPIVSNQAKILEQYQLIEQKSHHSGSHFFCKTCLMESLKGK